jgi:protein gp37
MGALMGERTGIAWTHHTFNPWWGCAKVSPACDNCYAETLAGRFGTGWGVESRRRFFGAAHWQGPVRWARKARDAGERRRVFCASMADVCEHLPPSHPDAMEMAGARTRLFDLIDATGDALDWLLLTKRPERAPALMPAAWKEAPPPYAWWGVTFEDQERADLRLPRLFRIPAALRFVSYEPALGPVAWHTTLPGIDWVICGGESGAGARPMHPAWARGARDACVAAGIPYFFKQWGDWLGVDGIAVEDRTEFRPSLSLRNLRELRRWDGDNRWRCADDDETAASFLRPGTFSAPMGKKAAGSTLDGREWTEVPAIKAA